MRFMRVSLSLRIGFGCGLISSMSTFCWLVVVVVLVGEMRGHDRAQTPTLGPPSDKRPFLISCLTLAAWRKRARTTGRLLKAPLCEYND